jgi:energy-converting hydrogenase Eha subunit G
MTANISLLEEIGFAKGGVNIGGTLANTNGMMVYADPTLAFRGKFGNSGLGWAFWIGAGYGFTSEAKGLVFRAAYEVFVSSLAVIGVEGVYLIPDSTVPTLKSVVGLHIGISLGR